jgi:putative ABC transport system permease protein
MQIRPVVSTLLRNKVGAGLIAAQIALSMAILCNALFIIHQGLSRASQPSGLDEANIFSFWNNWAGNVEVLSKDPQALLARVHADLAMLRGLPGVVDAEVTNGVPLSRGPGGPVSLKPNQQEFTNGGAYYFADDHSINTLGVRLTAGRNFTPEEIQVLARDSGPDAYGRAADTPAAAQIIVSRTLAQQLFPGESALGKIVYLYGGARPSTIIGIVERLPTPWSFGLASRPFVENSVLIPYLAAEPGYPMMVRVEPDRLRTLMQTVPKKLHELDRARELDHLYPFSETRREHYANDVALSIVLSVVCAILLAVTAFGIVGLASFWVTQRRRQIGVRRALGATRRDIVSFFLTENLIICATGAALGAALALALNLWMVKSFEMDRLNGGYAIVGAVFVLLLGQGAALWPALRAASVPPALATRSG